MRRPTTPTNYATNQLRKQAGKPAHARMSPPAPQQPAGSEAQRQRGSFKWWFVDTHTLCPWTTSFKGRSGRSVLLMIQRACVVSLTSVLMLVLELVMLRVWLERLRWLVRHAGN